MLGCGICRRGSTELPISGLARRRIVEVSNMRTSQVDLKFGSYPTSPQLAQASQFAVPGVPECPGHSSMSIEGRVVREPTRPASMHWP